MADVEIRRLKRTQARENDREASSGRSSRFSRRPATQPRGRGAEAVTTASRRR